MNAPRCRKQQDPTAASMRTQYGLSHMRSAQYPRCGNNPNMSFAAFVCLLAAFASQTTTALTIQGAEFIVVGGVHALRSGLLSRVRHALYSHRAAPLVLIFCGISLPDAHCLFADSQGI